MTYTPGPWEVYEGPEDRPELTVSYEDKSGQVVCVADCLQGEIPPKERIANARLIAAAPALVAEIRAAIKALQEDIAYFDDLVSTNDLNRLIAIEDGLTAALAHATGRQP